MIEIESNYNQLIEKLDQFIRKYYINKLIKGSLYSIGAVLGVFLLLNLLEYYFYFGSGVRKVFLLSFLGTVALGFIYGVGNPLIRYFKLSKTISHEDAAVIIGDHFGDVKDKLLNILQLKKQGPDEANLMLIEASIEQKTKEISLVPFKSAIDFNSNRKYLRYAIPPFMLLLVILFAAPSILREGTSRIINNDKQFAKAAPFSFNLDVDQLSVVQYKDYVMELSVEGQLLPNEVMIVIDDFEYRMQKESKNKFVYTFRNVQKDIDFSIQSGSVSSIPYKLKVLEKPNLTDFSIEMEFPAYTGRKKEFVQNSGDLIVPEGTKLTWLFEAYKTDKIDLHFGNKKELGLAERKNDSSFRYSKKVTSDEQYQILLSNSLVPEADSLIYNINVIKDQHPSIFAEKIVDSLDKTLIYFIGNTADDYGLNSLSFNYQITGEKGGAQAIQSVKIKKEEGRDIQFEYLFYIKKLNLNPGDKASFYFEVYDNDGVNGSKSSKTTTMYFEKMSLDEVRMQDEKNDEELKNDLKDALKNIDKLQNNIKKLKEKLLQEKQLNWQDKKELEKLLDEQKKILERIEKAKEKLDENIKTQNEFNTQPDEVKQKQEKLQEMMEKALDPETKELMDKIKELMQELEKEDAVQMLEQFEMNNESKEKEMKRMLELYKQLEMEKQVKDQIKDLEKLAENQEKLAEKTEKDQLSKEELKKEQEALNKKMDEIKEKQKELEKKNKELSPQKDMGEKNQEKMDDIKEDMNDSKEKISKSENKDAS